MRNVILVFYLLVSGFSSYSQTPKNCLHFDGNDDRIRYLTSVGVNLDWTLELWFKSENTSNLCATSIPSYIHKVITLGSDMFFIGQCGMSLFYQFGANPPVSFYNGLTSDWNHLAITADWSGMPANCEVKVYLNCVEVLNLPNLTPPVFLSNTGAFIFGNKSGLIPAIPPMGWEGFIDEIRLWNGLRTLQELEDNKHCPCIGNETNIRICSPLDQGSAGQNNSAIITALDLAPLANITNGILDNFSLNGSTSNFVSSDAPLIYPSFAHTEVMISQYFGATLIPANEICSGDPVHFCIKNLDGTPLNTTSANSTISLQWQYLDNTVAQFTDIPTFTNTCFGVGPGIMAIDCANNSDGYIDRKYRAVIQVEDITSGMSCTYFTEEFDMRICCPLSNAVVNVTTDLTNDLLCAVDNVNFNVSLNTPDFFLNPPGPGISIVWTYNGANINQNNQISFTHNVSPVMAPEACFEATVTNCEGKEMKYKTCLNVDLQPKCGVITEKPTGTLMQLSAVPLVYEICPGDDASLEKLNASVFQDGDFVWQYSFPNTLPGVWHDLGTNNDIQNTNILPVINPPGSPYLWPTGETCVVYRIEGRPFNDPSGCDSCHTNELNICLKTPPVNDVIVGNSKFCKGSSTILTLANYNSSFQHFWYWNGSYVGNGSSINAVEGGCYWVVISNGCESVTTPPHCIEECEIKAVLSCPLAPNMCPNAGDMITLSACDSESNCTDPLSYSFQWSNNVGSGMVNGCQMSHNVLAVGTSYTVTVTDTNGCSDTASINVVPCN